MRHKNSVQTQSGSTAVSQLSLGISREICCHCKSFYNNTKIHFLFNTNYSITTTFFFFHFIFPRKARYRYGIMRSPDFHLPLVASGWQSQVMCGELTHNICLVSATTALTSQLQLVPLLKKETQNKQKKYLAK